ncbi:MAG TPA: GGDEF domain-containing protein [Candidatus Bilophila faecipullorum]|uniref:diguanylate cyclase n=3 Tax=Bilophila TaxID=35832 RepID=A0A9D1R2Q1_9BACT|nr:GGDEF domain-containing protein [uncultured Bilophila sp.]HIW79900.1 GGDEF domain-containing protein [Candidatus Bilophila faecipullorum]
MFERKERFGPEKKILLVVALAILIASVSTFAILYWMMNAALQEDIRSRAQVVNAYSEDNINVYSFTHINGPEDGRRDTYAEVRAMLENIRQIANVRYLYTAKLDASGRPVYLVDGLPPDSPDFRHPGDFIEEDIVPMLKKCLSGKSIESDGVLNTEWGAIYLTCRPVYANGEERPLGAVVMEFNADAVYANNMRSMLYSGILCLLLVGACIVSTMFWLRRLAAPFYKKLAYTDMLTGLGNRTAFELRLRELEKETGRRNFIMVIYDLNEMKKVNDTYGHAVGDAYLQRMGSLLLRESPVDRGWAYRIGGDEFVVIFADEDEASLRDELERFQKTCATSEVGGQPVTFAYGLAAYAREIDGPSLHNTLSRADARMYARKKAERGGA